MMGHNNKNDYYIFRPCIVLDTVLSAFHYINSLRPYKYHVECYGRLHFSDEETEAQSQMCLTADQSPSQGLDPGSLGAQPELLAVTLDSPGRKTLK